MVNKNFGHYIMMGIVVVAVFLIDVACPKALNLTYTNYFGIEMTRDEYMTLMNLGFTEDEIYYMSEETFEDNKDLDAQLLASTTKYYKTVHPMYGASYTVEVTEDEYLNQGDALILDTVTTQYRQVISTISQNGTEKYRYKVTNAWLSMPEEHSYDVMGIGFVNSVYIYSSVYFNYVYADSSANYTTSTIYYDKKKTQYGGSAVYQVPTNIVSLSSNLYFDVKKNVTGSLSYIQMCGDYAHALSNVTTTQAANHYIASAGIDFDSSVLGYYDDVDCAYATVYNPWS